MSAAGPPAVVLALDTATAMPSVALGTPGERVPDVVIADRNELSRRLAVIVRDLCADRGVAPRSVSAVIVADGPGSFTGLRIGVAFAKGFHDALGVPLYAAASLLGAARSVCPGEGTVVAEYDALRGDVHRAVYRFTAEPPAVTTIQAPDLVPAAAPPPVGGGYLRAGERDASAAALLRLFDVPGGLRRIAAPAPWQPDYGRPAEAEARRLARDAAEPA